MRSVAVMVALGVEDRIVRQAMCYYVYMCVCVCVQVVKESRFLEWEATEAVEWYVNSVMRIYFDLEVTNSVILVF